MAIQINDNLNTNSPKNLDDRYNRLTIAERDAIDANVRALGLQCYVAEDDTIYHLKGGILNENWEAIGGAGVSQEYVDNKFLPILSYWQTIPNEYPVAFLFAVYNPDLERIVALHTDVYGSFNIAFYSDDFGLTWQECNFSNQDNYRSGIFSQGQFMFLINFTELGNGENIVITFDGINTSTVPFPDDGNFEVIIGNSERTIIAGSGNSTSNVYIDSFGGGFSFQAVLSIDFHDWVCGTYADGKFVLVAFDGTVAFSSDNAATWSYGNTGEVKSYNNIIFINGNWILTSLSGGNNLFRSTDLINWAGDSVPGGGQILSMATDGQNLIALKNSTNPRSLLSIDNGATFTLENTSVNTQFSSVIYLKDTFLAVSDFTVFGMNRSQKEILYSGDPISQLQNDEGFIKDTLSGVPQQRINGAWVSAPAPIDSSTFINKDGSVPMEAPLQGVPAVIDSHLTTQGGVKDFIVELSNDSEDVFVRGDSTSLSFNDYEFILEINDGALMAFRGDTQDSEGIVISFDNFVTYENLPFFPLDVDIVRVKYKNNVVYLLSAQSFFRTSDLGQNWIEASSISGTRDFSDFDIDDDGNICICSQTTGASNSQIYRSTDGGNTFTGHPAQDAFVVLQSISYSNGVWIAVSPAQPQTRKIQRSTDGITWTTVTAPISVFSASLVRGNGNEFYIFENLDSGTFLKSIDGGITFELVGSLPTSNTPKECLFLGSKVIYLAGNIAYVSSNGGLEWLPVPLDIGTYPTLEKYGASVVLNKAIFIHPSTNYIYAFTNKFLLRSGDKISELVNDLNYTTVPVAEQISLDRNIASFNTFIESYPGNGGSPWQAIVEVDGVFVMGSRTGTQSITVARSTDKGDTWTYIDPLISISPVAMQVINGVIYVHGDNLASVRIAKSEDLGLTWSIVSTTPNPFYTRFYHDGNTSIGVSFSFLGGNIGRSIDGNETYTLITNPAGANLRGVAGDGNGNWVVCGSSDIGNIGYSDDDGLTWTFITPPDFTGTIVDVVFGKGLFILVTDNGDNRVGISRDLGVTWEIINIPVNNNFTRIKFSHGLFYAVSSSGNNRMMISSSGEEWSMITLDPLVGFLDATFDGEIMIACSGIIGGGLYTTSVGRLIEKTVKDVPNDDATYGRRNGEWVEITTGPGSTPLVEVAWSEELVFENYESRATHTQVDTINYTVALSGNTKGNRITHVLTTDGVNPVNFDFNITVEGTIVSEASNLLEFYYPEDGKNVICRITQMFNSVPTNPSVVEAYNSNLSRDVIYVQFDVPVKFVDTTGLSVDGGYSITGIRLAGEGLIALDLDNDTLISDTLTLTYGGTNTITDVYGMPLLASTSGVTNNITLGTNVKSFSPVSPFNSFIHLANELPYSDSEGSISFWIKMDQFQNTEEEIFSYSHNGIDTVLFSVRLINSAVDSGAKVRLSRIFTGTPGTFSRTAQTQDFVLDDLNWHLIVITSDTLPLIYIDGVSVAVDPVGAQTGAGLWFGSYTALPITNPMTNIGATQFAGNMINYLRQKIDQFAVWNIKLSAGQITELYNGGNWLDLSSHSAQANVVSWFDFNDTVEDSRGFILNPTIVGSAGNYNANIP